MLVIVVGVGIAQRRNRSDFRQRKRRYGLRPGRFLIAYLIGVFLGFARNDFGAYKPFIARQGIADVGIILGFEVDFFEYFGLFFAFQHPNKLNLVAYPTLGFEVKRNGLARLFQLIQFNAGGGIKLARFHGLYD